MADPTLRDVLDALAKLDSKVSNLDARVATIDAKVSTIDAKLDAHRLETEKGFRQLDAELTKHAEVHRELEKDISALKGRPPRTAARAPRRR